ncbi:type I toxin-antitoxin system toxin IbsC, partial [Escherichia coli]
MMRLVIILIVLLLISFS